MNEYMIGSIVVAFLLGWTIGSTAGKAKGYALAMYQYQQQTARDAMAARLNAMLKEENNETNEA